MLVLANILLAFSMVSTFVLGLIIYVSGSRKRINLYLAAAFVAIVLWLLANLLTNITESPETSLIFARTTLVGSSLIPYFFLIFALEFVGSSKRKAAMYYLLILPLVLLLFTPTSLNIVSVESYGANTELGAIYPLIIVLYVLYFGIFTRLMWREYRSKASPQRSNQAKLVLIGLLLTAIPALLTNAVLPLFGFDDALYYGPSSVLLLVYFTSVAIVRHRLFNIRLVIARTLAYLGILVVLLFFYLLGAFQLSNYLQSLTNIEFLGQIVTFITTVLVAVMYGPTKRFFDRITNKFFYQDAYEPQKLIDELNQVLVSNVDLEILLERTAAIISSNIKTSFCTFYIRPTSYLPERIIGVGRSGEFKNLPKVHELAPKIDRKIFASEATLDVQHESTLASYLREDDVQVLARLVNTVEYEVSGVGYILIGQKNSGGQYSKKDLKIIEIIANELVIAIENVLRYEEIDKFNVTLQKKIDDATGELKRSNEKLKALDEAKDEFVSMASHQLRTPLTSIKGYVSMVNEEDVGKLNEEQKKMLGQALFSSQRMVYLISDLLNVSRLKTGKFVIEAKPVYLPDVIESELEQLKEGVAAKNITLAYNKPKKFPVMSLDEMKIRQVIMNFTDNAIYYTPSGGKITIELKDKDDSVEFIVKDTGIGVPKSERHKLFTKFYRAENAKKARPDGTGLGLFMAKKVVIAQGGSIIFESREGKGSTFGFSFPKAELLVDEEAKPEEKHE